MATCGSPSSKGDVGRYTPGGEGAEFRPEEGFREPNRGGARRRALDNRARRERQHPNEGPTGPPSATRFPTRSPASTRSRSSGQLDGALSFGFCAATSLGVSPRAVEYRASSRPRRRQATPSPAVTSTSSGTATGADRSAEVLPSVATGTAACINSQPAPISRACKKGAGRKARSQPDRTARHLQNARYRSTLRCRRMTNPVTARKTTARRCNCPSARCRVSAVPQHGDRSSKPTGELPSGCASFQRP